MLTYKADESGWQWQIREDAGDRTTIFTFYITLWKTERWVTVCNTSCRQGRVLDPLGSFCSLLFHEPSWLSHWLHRHENSRTVCGTEADKVGEGTWSWSAGLGHWQAEQLHPIQPLFGDRYNIDVWLAKVKMRHSRKTARVAACSWTWVLLILSKNASHSPLPSPLLPFLLLSSSSPYPGEMGQRKWLSWSGAYRQEPLILSGAILSRLKWDSLAALWTQDLPSGWVFGWIKKYTFSKL